MRSAQNVQAWETLSPLYKKLSASFAGLSSSPSTLVQETGKEALTVTLNQELGLELLTLLQDQVDQGTTLGRQLCVAHATYRLRNATTTAGSGESLD